MQKKSLILMFGLSCLVLVGCGSKSGTAQTIDTGSLFSGEQVLTGMMSGDIISGQNSNLREEVTGDNTNGSLSVTGQVATGATSGNTATSVKTVSNDVANLIKARATKAKDPNKLTEDDIELMDKVIQKLESIGK